MLLIRCHYFHAAAYWFDVTPDVIFAAADADAALLLDVFATLLFLLMPRRAMLCHAITFFTLRRYALRMLNADYDFD